MQKHSAAIHELSDQEFSSPFADPFINIYEVKKLRTLTYEIFHQQWKLKLEGSTKCDTYRLFKDKMKFEEYLLHPNRKERIAMAKLRISDHKLMIEVGRHRRPVIAREERLCYMCKDKVEDEIHFLTECNIYGSRNIFWDQVHLKFPQTAELSTKTYKTYN